MKTPRKKKVLTFGELITALYDAYGKPEAVRLIRLAVNTHTIIFRGHRYGAIA